MDYPCFVDRCFCNNITFERWLNRVRQNNWTLAEAALHTRCGEGCGMCRKYLEVVYATGQTKLPLLLPEEKEVYFDDID